MGKWSSQVGPDHYRTRIYRIVKDSAASTNGETDSPDSVDIKSSFTTDSELILHCGLGRGIGADVVEPVGVDGSGGVAPNPSDAEARVSGVHDINLIVELGVRNVATSRSAILADNVEVDGNGDNERT
jgi:hypothetical protein